MGNDYNTPCVSCSSMENGLPIFFFYSTQYSEIFHLHTSKMAGVGRDCATTFFFNELNSAH